MSAADGVKIWRRRIHTAQVLIVLILVLGTVYVADTVVGGSLFRDPSRLTVELPQAAGLHEGSVVTYRGQRIGKVVEVRLSGPDAAEGVGIIAEIEYDSGVEIPVDSDFEVRNLSAVGEQYLDVRPRSPAGEVYADGATVPLEDAVTPLGVPDVLADAQRLMGHLSVADLRTIAAESERIFAGEDVDLRALSIELESAFAMLRELEPELTALARDAEVPLRTGVELEERWRSLARDLALVTSALRSATPDIKSTVIGATDLLPRLDRWWRRASPDLRSLLRNGLPLSEMSAQHLRGLHHWLDWAPMQADAMAGSTRDGSGRVLLVPRILKNCIYDPSVQRDVHDTSPRDVPTDVRCTNPPPGTQARGSANVPEQ